MHYLELTLHFQVRLTETTIDAGNQFWSYLETKSFVLKQKKNIYLIHFNLYKTLAMYYT